MIIRTLVTNVVTDESSVREYTVDIFEHASLQDLFNELECGLADVSDYYEFSGAFSWNNFYCPFILTTGDIQYNLPYSEVKLSDFIRTHSIDDNVIRIVTGYPQAGGPGFIALKDIWDAVLPWLNGIAIFCSISGINVKDIVNGIRSHFENKRVPPHTVIDILATRKYWNHKELSKILDIPEENATYLLKTFGYKYDKQLMLYVPSNMTTELREKIKSVQIYDV